MLDRLLIFPISYNQLTCFEQALDVIRLIKTVLPLDRAMMRLKVESTSKDAKKLKEKFVALASSVESENWDSGEITLVQRIILLLNYIYFHKIFKKY